MVGLVKGLNDYRFSLLFSFQVSLEGYMCGVWSEDSTVPKRGGRQNPRMGYQTRIGKIRLGVEEV